MSAIPRTTIAILIVAMGIFTLFGSSDKPDLDELVLTRLKTAGSDLSKPHTIEFFLYFPTQAAAEQAAARVRKDGFQVEVDPPVSDTKWQCVATKKMVPDLKAFRDLREAFERLAWLLKGTYDGWGTSVEN